MRCWWMMPFGVWKWADVLLFSAWCEMVVLGRGREPALERELPPPPPHQQSAWQLQWGGCLRTLSDGAAPCARGKEGWAEEHDTAWLQHVASSPAMYCRPGAAWGSCSHSCAGIGRERPGRCPKPSLSLRLLFWFHQHKPLVMAPFSPRRDPGWPCLLRCSRPCSNRALLLRLLFFFFSW